MHVQVAVICDAATDQGGKLNLLGAFDTLVAAHLPVAQPLCSIALRVVFERGDAGTHLLRLRFVDGDGEPILRVIEFPVEIVLREGESFTSRNYIINLQQLRFEKPGEHAVEISIDDRQEARIPLQVRLAPQA